MYVYNDKSTKWQSTLTHGSLCKINMKKHYVPVLTYFSKSRSATFFIPYTHIHYNIRLTKWKNKSIIIRDSPLLTLNRLYVNESNVVRWKKVNCSLETLSTETDISSGSYITLLLILYIRVHACSYKHILLVGFPQCRIYKRWYLKNV